MRSTLHQCQMFGHSRAGRARGAGCAQAPAIVHDNAQEGAIGFTPSRCAVSTLENLAGCNSRSLYSHRRAATSPAAAVSRVRGSLHFASGTHSYGARLQPRSIIRATGSNRSRAHTCPMKPASQFFAYRDFLLHFGVLSCDRFDGSNKPSKWSRDLGKVTQGLGKTTRAGRGHV